MKTIIIAILSLSMIGILSAKDSKDQKLKKISLTSITKNPEDFLVKWGDKKFIAKFKTEKEHKAKSPEKVKAAKVAPQLYGPRTRHGVIKSNGKDLQWAGYPTIQGLEKKRMEYVCSVKMGSDAKVWLLIHKNK